MIRWEPEEEQAADLAQIQRDRLRRALTAALGRKPTGEEMERASTEWSGEKFSPRGPNAADVRRVREAIHAAKESAPDYAAVTRALREWEG